MIGVKSLFSTVKVCYGGVTTGALQQTVQCCIEIEPSRVSIRLLLLLLLQDSFDVQWLITCMSSEGHQHQEVLSQMNPLSVNVQAPCRCWVKEESFATSCSKQGVLKDNLE